MAFFPPRTRDPLVALKAIREQCPQAGGKKLLDIFYAVVIEDRHLHRVIIAQAFASALERLNLPDRQREG